MNQKNSFNSNSTFSIPLKIWMVYWILTQKIKKKALIYAVLNGYKEIVELLLKQNGIDVNIKDILKFEIFIKF